MLDSLQAATVDNREHEAFIVHVVSPAEFYCQTKAAAESQPEPEPAAPQESREELERMMLEIQRKLQSMN
nr:hypothetical protein BaRGS_015449 [Batillaria attramentaria]